MNTAFTYMYRDADNYKELERIVLVGELSKSDREVIMASRDDGQFFIPSQVGLTDLQERLASYGSGELTDSDHVWHSLEDDAFELTEEDPTEPALSAADLAERFANVKWDIGRAMTENGIPNDFEWADLGFLDPETIAEYERRTNEPGENS